MKNKNVSIYEYLGEEINESETDEITKNLYISTNDFNDKKTDSRTDAIINLLQSIKFWVAIIGIYSATQILILIIKAIAAYKLGNQIINIFK